MSNNNEQQKESPPITETTSSNLIVPKIMNSTTDLSEKGKAALAYLKSGYCPLPVNENKKPTILTWKEYQYHQPTENDVRQWWQERPNANIALITGHGGLTVLDIDVKANPANQEIADKIAGAMRDKTIVVKTPSGGFHIYFIETDTRSSAAMLGKFGEFRAAGLYVLAPPSTGYTFVGEARRPMEIMDAWGYVTDYLFQFGFDVTQLRAHATRQNILSQPIRVGERNSSLTSLAGSLRHRGGDEATITIALKSINKERCQPPLDEEEVEVIAHSVSRYEPAQEKLDSGLGNIYNNRESRNNFKLKTLAQLLREPLDNTPWLIENLLPLGGTSLDAAKPKVGKTTKNRNLAHAVIKCTDFLGRKVLKQGSILYYALEEKPAEFIESFRKMGCDTDQIHIHFGMAPEKPIEALKRDIEFHQPVLVVIDPIQRFIRIKDINDYASVSLIMEPIQEMARNYNCHIMLVHHLGKMSREDGDDVLGSTALFGSVDTLLITKKREDEMRTIQTRQRYGEDLKETILTFDKASQLIGMAGTFNDHKEHEIDESIIEAVKDGFLTESEIKDLIGGNQTKTSKALRRLFEKGILCRSGNGKRGDPYKYELNTSL